MNYKQDLVAAIREAGQLIIDKAEEICADCDTEKISSINIWVNCEPGSVVKVQFEKEYTCMGDWHYEYRN